MRLACFGLLVIALLGLFGYEFARRERSWDGAPEEEAEEERGLDLAHGAGDNGWLDPWPWLWCSGTEATESGFTRRPLQLQGRLRGITTATMVEKRHCWRKLQLLEAAGLRPFQQPADFTTAGLRRAPPYLALSNCFFMCVNLSILIQWKSNQAAHTPP